MQTLMLLPSSPDLFLKYRTKIPFLATAFVFFFLLSFQPFQFRLYSYENKVLVGLAWIICTLCVTGTSHWFVPRVWPQWFSPATWSIHKELLFVGLNILVIAAGIFCFKVAYGFYDVSLERVGTGLAASVAIGILPAAFYKLASIAYTDQQIPPAIPVVLPPRIDKATIQLCADRGEQVFEACPEDILLIEVKKNYLWISYRSEQAIKTYKLRNRMRYAEQVLADHPYLCRCHRAFIINKHAMLNQQLNAHGGTIQLDGISAPIPVSRTYAAYFY